MFKVTQGDTDSISICYEDFRYISPEERKQIHDEINALFPPMIKFADDGYAKIALIFRAKNYCFRLENDQVKTKGSGLRSSKIEPALKKYQQRILNALLEFTDENVMDIYRDECKAVASLASINDWCSRKALSEKTFSSTRKNEMSLKNAVAGSGAVIGDRVMVYFTASDDLKLMEQYNPSNPDHNVKRLLTKLYNSTKLFETVVPELSLRTNYGLSTKAKEFNNLVRNKVLPVKKKKPTPKNVLQELLDLISKKELNFFDDYAEELFNDLVVDAQVVLTPKPKVPRKKKDETNV